MPPLRLTGGDILAGGRIAPGSLSWRGETIVEGHEGGALDATGYLILPGIVDLHGDGFERHLAPRRGAMPSLAAGLASFDAELAANGITTAVMAQFVSWEGGMRGPDFAEAVVEAVSGFDAMTDLHLQLRLETHLVPEFARVLRLIDRAAIRYVVFNDHLPHAALAAGKRPPRLTGQALKSARSPETHLALMQGLHEARADVPDALARLAAELVARGVILGSHDDATPERREGYRALGARIAEFPETQATAQAARDAGDRVVMGAPNVVRGASHNGMVSARTLVDAGLVDALVSDYHYPSPARAAFLLADAGLGLAAAWALISSGPAKVLGLSDRGHLMPGARADLVVVNAQTRRVEATIAAGRVSHMAGGFAERVLAARCA